MNHIEIEEKPEVSIVVPMYNAEKWIASTMNSLITQEFKNLEIIVVNDGSTDNSENTLKHFFFDKRIRYFKKENGGTGSALNIGHYNARGKYVTWCSADNIYFPNFISVLHNAITQFRNAGAPVHFVYSDFTYIDERGRRFRDLVHQNPQPRNDLVNGYDLGMSFLYSKELWDKTGPYWNRICEDYDWVVRAAQHTEFGLVRAILAAFRVHPGQITGSRQAEELAAANDCKALARKLIAEGKYGDLAPK